MTCHFALLPSRRLASLLLANLLLALTLISTSAAAATQNVRIMMDWLVQGTHTPFILADAKGYFKDEGLSARIDSGKGATNVAVSVASGTYQFGLVDFPALVNFDAHNPSSQLVAVYIYFQSSPLAFVSTKSDPIRTRAELDGKRVAGGAGTAAHDSIGLLIKPSDSMKIKWVSAQPQLFGPMMRRGQIDAVSGFTNSMIPAAIQAGFNLDDLVTMKFSQFGVNPYGMALVTTKTIVDSDPQLIKAVVKAVNRGLIETIEDPDGSLKYLLQRDSLLDPKIEALRLKLALDLIDTPYVHKYGVGGATPERLQYSIDSVMSWNGVPKAKAPTIASIYTDAFLPPLADRTLPK